MSYMKPQITHECRWWHVESGREGTYFSPIEYFPAEHIKSCALSGDTVTPEACDQHLTEMYGDDEDDTVWVPYTE